MRHSAGRVASSALPPPRAATATVPRARRARRNSGAKTAQPHAWRCPPATASFQCRMPSPPASARTHARCAPWWCGPPARRCSRAATTIWEAHAVASGSDTPGLRRAPPLAPCTRWDQATPWPARRPAGCQPRRIACCPCRLWAHSAAVRASRSSTPAGTPWCALRTQRRLLPRKACGHAATCSRTRRGWSLPSGRWPDLRRGSTLSGALPTVWPSPTTVASLGRMGRCA